MRNSLFRLLTVLATGGLILALVLGSSALSRVDPMLVAQVEPTTPVVAPTLTPLPTRALDTSVPTVTPEAVEPTVMSEPSRTPTPPSPLFKRCEDHPAGWIPYLVQPWETLQELAARAGLAVRELRRANCEVTEVQVGDRIYMPKLALATVTPVPTQPPQCVPYRPAGWTTLLVRAGETLYTLARRHGTTVARLSEVNCLTTDQIYAGQTLYAPDRIVVPPTPIPTLLPTETPTLPPTWTSTPTPVLSTETSTPEPTTPPPSPTPTSTPTPTPVPPSSAVPTTAPPPTSTPTPVPTSTSTSTPSLTPTATPTPVPSTD